MSILNSLTEKHKQKLRTTLVIAAVIVVVVILVMSMESTNKSTDDGKPSGISPKKGKFSLLTDKVEKDVWMAVQGQNIKKLEKENKEFKKQIEGFKKALDDMKKREKSRVLVPSKKNVSPSSIKSKPLPPLPSSSESSQRKVIQRSPSAPLVSQDSIRVYTDILEKGKANAPETKKEKPEDKSITLASGSFMKGVLLNGINAPTDFGSKTEPYPVLISVADLTVLPNLYRMNLKDCFIIGAGYGNLADERAYIRTEKISCITASGNVIDTNLKGHVVGEDGKLGLRGKLISKQGQLIVKSLLSGSLSGFASAFKPQQSVSINLNPSGNTGFVTPSTGDILRAGGAEGVSTALNKIADFYLKMAEKIFPIIEVDAGRKVDILVLEQSKLDYSKSLIPEGG